MEQRAGRQLESADVFGSDSGRAHFIVGAAVNGDFAGGPGGWGGNGFEARGNGSGREGANRRLGRGDGAVVRKERGRGLLHGDNILRGKTGWLHGGVACCFRFSAFPDAAALGDGDDFFSGLHARRGRSWLIQIGCFERRTAEGWDVVEWVNLGGALAAIEESS